MMDLQANGEWAKPAGGTIEIARLGIVSSPQTRAFSANNLSVLLGALLFGQYLGDPIAPYPFVFIRHLAPVKHSAPPLMRWISGPTRARFGLTSLDLAKPS